MEPSPRPVLPVVDRGQQSSYGLSVAWQGDHQGFSLPDQNLASSPVVSYRKVADGSPPGAATVALQQRLHGQASPRCSCPTRRVVVMNSSAALAKGSFIASCPPAATTPAAVPLHIEQPQAARQVVQQQFAHTHGPLQQRAVSSQAGGSRAQSPSTRSSLGAAGCSSTTSPRAARQPAQAVQVGTATRSCAASPRVECRQVQATPPRLEVRRVTHSASLPAQLGVGPESPLQRAARLAPIQETTPMQQLRVRGVLTTPSPVQDPRRVPSEPTFLKPEARQPRLQASIFEAEPTALPAVPARLEPAAVRLGPSSSRAGPAASAVPERAPDERRVAKELSLGACAPTPVGVAVASPPADLLPETPLSSVLLEPLAEEKALGAPPEGIHAQTVVADEDDRGKDDKCLGLKEALTAATSSANARWRPGRFSAAASDCQSRASLCSSRAGSGASTPAMPPLLRGLSGRSVAERLSRNVSAKSDGGSLYRSATPLHHRPPEESLVLGVSVAFLETAFLEEVAEKLGCEADPDYYAISAEMLYGPRSRGYGMRCPRDGLPHCSYVDALDCRDASMADVMLSWVWSYPVRTVVNALTQWCRRKGRDPRETFVWQCALCMNQHRVEEKKKAGEVEAFEVFRDIFEARVRSIGHMLALLSPWNQPQYIQRIWCVFELWVAQNTPGCEVELALPQEQEEPFREALESEGVQALWRTFEKVRIQDAKATSEEDRRNILRLVDPDAEDYSTSLRCDALNHSVVAQLQQWCVDTSAGHIQRCLAKGEAVPPAACVNLAGLLFQVSDWERALSILEAERHALESAGTTATPEYAGLLQNVGVCLSHQGRDMEAVNVYMLAKAAYEASCALPSAQYAGLLLNLGAWYGDRQQFGEALHFYQASKAAYEASSATTTPHYASLLHSMGACYARQGLQQEASRAFLEAKRAHDALDAGNTPEYAELLQSMGSRCTAQGRHEEAMGHFAAARAAFEATGATRTPQCAVLLLNMGTCLFKLGRKAEAMEMYDESRDAFEASGAAMSSGFGDLMRNVGVCHASMGRTVEAAQVYVKAKEVYEAIGKAFTGEYAGLLQEMGELYSSQGLHYEAAGLYEIAKGTYESSGACRSPRYAGLLQNLGVSLTHQGRHAEAAQAYAGAKAIYEDSGLQGTPAYAGLLRNLGGCFTSQGRQYEATQFYSQAKLAYEVAGVTTSPKYSLEYAALCHNIGESCNQDGRTSEACELYATARVAYESSGATSTDEYAGLLQKMGMGFAVQGHHAKAMELYRETKEAYEVLGMTSTQHYAALLHNMAIENGGQGNDDEALEMYVHAKVAYEAAGMSDRLEYGRLLLGTGTCHARHGRDDEALEALSAAKATYDALGAHGTVEYASLLQNTGACRARRGESREAIALYTAAKAVYERAGAQATPNYAALVQALTPQG